MSFIGFLDTVKRPGRRNRIDVSAADPLPVTSPNGAGASYTKGASVVTLDDLGSAVGAVTPNLTIDSQDYQSVVISFEATAAYTGGYTIETSMDNVNWRIKQLTSTDGGTPFSSTGHVGQTGLLNLVMGDIGARYIRVRQTSWTAGNIRVRGELSALSTTAPNQQSVLGTGLNLVGAFAAGHDNDDTTTALLAAGATYTSSATDQSGTPRLWRTRARVEVAHAAGLAFGHLILEQSPDNATWRETERIPVPSDGMVHSFELTVHNRYWRVKFLNGATAQTAFYLHRYAVGVEGQSPDTKQNLQFALSQTALAANAQFTSPALDLGANHSWGIARLAVFSDQGGSFACDQSRDGVNWRTLRPTEAGLGATTSGVGTSYSAGNSEYSDYKIVMRYLRFRVGAGATAQTTLDVNAALLSL